MPGRGGRPFDDNEAVNAGETSGLVFGHYGPGSEAWQLNREAAALLAAGPRALLMQIAHPLVAEGVEQHSRFRQEPRARLERTLRSYLRIVFGTPEDAAGEIDRLNRLHRWIRGPVSDPVAARRWRSYNARDPELSLWVHATLIDSTMVAYDAWIEPLSEDRAARFYEETRPIGLAFGIPDELLPADLAAFRSYRDGMLGPDGPVKVTPTARSQAQVILHPRAGTFLFGSTDRPNERGLAGFLDRVPTSAYDWLLWPGLELLPAELRAGYAIPDDAVRRLVAGWLVAGFRFWRPLFPTWLRWMPQAIAADRRTLERSATRA